MSSRSAPFKLPLLWYGLGFAMLAIVLVLSLVPVPAVEGGNDKVSHLLVYVVLSGWFSLLARNHVQLLGHFVGLVLFGMLIEFLQGLTGYRFAEWGDVLANVSGCVIGLVGYWAPLQQLLRRVDLRLASGL